MIKTSENQFRQMFIFPAVFGKQVMFSVANIRDAKVRFLARKLIHLAQKNIAFCI
jgi:hypothetical protein